MRKNNFSGVAPNLSDGIISLRRLTLENVSENYHNWLNDPNVNEFLECRHIKHTKESVSQFISKTLNEESTQLLLGIFLDKSNTHIGNIKLDQVNWIHRHGIIGLIIGERDSWGKGFGTRAISLLTDYSITTLKLKTLKAGCYSENIGSYKAFIKAGWRSIGRISNYWVNNKGNRTDELLLSYETSNLENLDFPDSGGFTLIGGSKLLVDTALILRSKGFEVCIVLAPRHKNKYILSEISKLNCRVLVSDNINEDGNCLEELKKYDNCCLCFGPAWIFKDKVLKIYNGRIFNINRIPLPDYLGGAHFTWQILNQSLDGGAFIQQITEEIDRGPIALKKNYLLSKEFRYPSEYEEFNYFKGLDLVKEFIELIIKNKKIILDYSCIDWKELSYFPRLNTSKNAWINWQWSALDIQLFCGAFDSPYPGARTKVNGKTVVLRNVILYKNDTYHPYCSGLIIRIDKENGEFFILAPGGILKCNLILENGDDIFKFAKLGDRLFTSITYLEASFDRPKYNSQGIAD